MNYLEGIGIAGYRSFGEDMQYLAPLRKVNIIVGKNNVGKSNILTFLNDRFMQLKGALDFQKRSLTPGEDVHRTGNPKFRVALGMDLRGKLREETIKRFGKSDKVDIGIEGVFTIPKALSQTDETRWFEYSSQQPFSQLTLDLKLHSDRLLSNDPKFWPIWYNLFSGIGSGGNHQTIPTQVGLIQAIAPNNLDLPDVVLVPAFRRVGNEQNIPSDYSGLGLTQKLFVLQHPNSRDYNEHKRQFDAITTFVKNVLEDDSARLEVSYDQSEIIVSIGEDTMSLVSLGTGIHQVIILAAASTLITNSILCIEELELHMHPSLQRKLMNYLSQTTNQYFITTHSAHIIDTPGAALFQITKVDKNSIATTIDSGQSRFAACTDLGYRASDIVQSNCIVWVEGPSDRIYMNAWISEIDMSLIEGVHFSIMFYGGKLRSHLSVADPNTSTVEDFVALLPLNRNVAMLMDSDRDSEESQLGETALRLQKEIAAVDGCVWITKGRTIENYIDHTLLQRAVRSVHSTVDELREYGQFGFPLVALKNDQSLLKAPDKIRIAQEVTQADMNLDVLDLRAEVMELIRFIRKANGLAT